MPIFSWLYAKTLKWSEHASARYILAGVSFTEASCFPVPPDILLIPMGIASPKHAWRLATIATVFSVLGGILGYYLGAFFMDLLMPLVIKYGYSAQYVMVKQWFSVYGFWALFVAGVTPIPYKLFTLTAGAVHLPLIPFVMVSFLGRGFRFYLVSAIIYFGGERLQSLLTRYIDAVGWLLLLLVVLGGVIYII